MIIKIDELRENIVRAFSGNFSQEDANRAADYIIWADMSGISTQGVIKMAGTEPLQNIKPKSRITVERDTKLSQLINAAANPAPIVTMRATEVAIQKAKDHGFGIVGVRNTFSSNGAQAYYAEMIASKDLIGIVCSRSPASTTGFDSIDPLFGTNPIGFGFPTTSEPLVFDMATSAMTFYGLVLANAKGEAIPENMAIDENGELTTDPAAAMKGALLSFDRGYKGAGLGMVIETLTGPLLGSAWIDNKTFEEEWGSTIIAIDPELLIDKDKFKENVTDMINKIKDSRKSEGLDEIRLPGERSRKAYEESKASGEVEIEDTIAEELGWM